MKTFAASATTALILGLLFGTTATSSAAADPAQVTLHQAIQIPVQQADGAKGSINIPGGLTVNVDQVQPDQLLIDFAGAQAWIPKSMTDFETRQAVSNRTEQTAQAILQQVWQQKAEIAKEQQEQANADWQGKLDGYISPLESGPYNYNRSVVDYYDCDGNRYNIGVFGQRIYN